MSHQQREALDSMLRSAPSTVAATIQEQRAAYEEFLSMFPVPDGIRHEPTEIGGRPALLVSPQTKQTEQTEQRAGTILYLHGGAWVMGSPQGYLSLTANLVRVAGIPAISPDYRLAPEHPFPAAVEDTLAAYRDLLEQGHESSSIIFAGDSAGGGLSITAALSAQAAGLPMPAGIVAFSPGLDITWSGASITERRHLDPVFTPESLIAMTSSYIGAADPAQPLLSPALGADLTGLPPILLQVGGNELMLDDSTRLAALARSANVDVTLDVIAGVPHVFQLYTGQIDEAGEALERAALFIRQRLGSVRRS